MSAPDIPPPPPFNPQPDPPKEMSAVETLTAIFFEPSRVFESLRERPRFLVAALVIVIAFFAYYISYIQKVGYETLITAELNSGTRGQQMSPEDRERAIGVQMKPVVKVLRYGAPIITFAIFFSAGAALYLLGTLLVGKALSYKQALAVWTYSSLPPTLLLMLLNIIMLFIKMPEDDPGIVKGQGGLVHANPGLFIDGQAYPAMATAAGAIDVFAFYGLFLAALGLRKVSRLSSGSAWGIVLGLWIIGVILRVVLAAIFGRPFG
jgi:hypothetical protein